MRFRYGSYTHEENSVFLSTASKKTEYKRGQKYAVVHSLSYTGTVTGSSQSSIRSKIQALENAYSIPVSSAGLYHDNGSASPHVITTAGALGPIEVVDLSWTGAAGEYATQRSFSISLQVRKLATGGDNLESFTENIVIQGTGGPKKAVGITLRGAPRRQTIAEKTPILITQNGSAIGKLSYPAPPPPLFPSDEHQDRRVIGRSSPSKDSGMFLGYGVNWSYTFEKLSGNVNATPSQQ